MKIIPLLLSSFLFMQCTSIEKPLVINWSLADSLPKTISGEPQIGVAGPIVGIHQDHLLIAGGANFPDKMPWEGGIKRYQRSAYIYNSAKSPLTLVDTVSFETAIAYSANCSTADGIYSAGGENEEGASSQFTRYQWHAANKKFETEKLTNLPVPLSNGNLVSEGSELFFIGGENASIVSDKIYVFDHDWQEFIQLPYPITHSVSLTKDGNIYIFGGRSRQVNAISTIYKSCLKINIKTKEITKIADLPEPIAAATGFVDQSGHLVFIGGDNGATFHQVEQYLLAIQKEINPVEKERLIKEKNKLQAAHPGFGKNVLLYHEQSNTWIASTDLPIGSPVTTTAVMNKNNVYIPSGEIKAGVRSAGILTGSIN